MDVRIYIHLSFYMWSLFYDIGYLNEEQWYLELTAMTQKANENRKSKTGSKGSFEMR